MTPDILITEDIEDKWIQKLKQKFTVRNEPEFWRSSEKIKAVIPGCSALIVRNQTQLSEEIIAEGANLKVIGRAGAGLDNIDVEAASQAGIVVTNTPDQNSISVAELAIGMMISLARKLSAANNHVRKGNWQRQQFMGTELYGKTLGVIGLGRIGFMTARRAHALGMNILAHDAYVSPDAAVVTEAQAELIDLEELLNRADFVSCHLPLTPKTKHFLNYEQFCKMKSTAFFLNLSRGGVINEQELVRALRDEQIRGAGLDVREKEPPGESPLCELKNIILTPHIAAFTQEAQERVAATVCRDVRSVLEGKEAQNYVNFSKPQSSASLIKER